MLLILAGVSLSAVFSEKGIFSRAEKAGNKYNEAKAREVLETVLLADGQYEKQSNPKYNQDDFLNELITKEIEGVEIKGDVAIIDGWAFLLDRSVPKIGEPLGRAEKLVFPTVKVSEPVLAEDYRTSSFTVTAIEETNGINKIEIWLNGEKIKDLDKTYSNIKEEIEQEFTVNKNGVYTVKVYGKLMASATVEVTGVVPAVEFTPNGSTEWKKQHSTKITVKETGETITSMKYLWTTSGTNEPEVSAFSSAESCTNNSIITGGNDTMTGTYYLWVLLTIDSGKTNICGSEGFNFDNKAPTVKLESTPVSETAFTLTATASDNKSGISRYDFYIDEVKVDSQITTEGTATYTWNGNGMAQNKKCYVIVTDGAGNNQNKACTGRTMLYCWEVFAPVGSSFSSSSFSDEVPAGAVIMDMVNHGNLTSHYHRASYIYKGSTVYFNEKGAIDKSRMTLRFERVKQTFEDVWGNTCDTLVAVCQDHYDAAVVIKSASNLGYKDGLKYYKISGYLYTSSSYVPGDSYGNKYSINRAEYPDDDIKSGWWYIYKGIG